MNNKLEEEALHLMRIKNWKESIILWKKVREEYPNRQAPLLQGAIAYRELEKYNESAYLFMKIKAYSHLVNILEKIELSELYEDIFILLIREEYKEKQPTAISARILSMYYTNRSLHNIYIEKIKKYIKLGIRVDYFTLLACGLVSNPDKSYIEKLYLENDSYSTKRIFSNLPIHRENIKTLVSLNIFNKHKSIIIERAYKEIFLENKYTYSNINNIEKKLKIAVCISGQLRGFNDAFKSWEKLNFNQHKVDFYCSVWKKKGGKKATPRQPLRTFNKEFSRAFTNYTEGLSTEIIVSKFSNIYSFLDSTSNLEASIDEINSLYSPKKLSIVDDSLFLDKNNMYKMHYMIESSWNLIDNPDEYDLIIRLRPDKTIKSFQTNWGEILNICQQNTLMTDLFPFVHPDIGFTIGDQFAVSTPSIMQKYSNTFSNIVNKKGVYNEPNYRNFMPHVSLYLGMIEDNIRVIGSKKIIFGEPIDSSRISNKILTQLIEKDFQEDAEAKKYFLEAIDKDILVKEK